VLLLRQNGEVSLPAGYVFELHTLLAVIIDKATLAKDGICRYVLGMAPTHEIELRSTTSE
jgi:hypothetical protein